MRKIVLMFVVLAFSCVFISSAVFAQIETSRNPCNARRENPILVKCEALDGIGNPDAACYGKHLKVPVVPVVCSTNEGTICPAGGGCFQVLGTGCVFYFVDSSNTRHLCNGWLIPAQPAGCECR